MLCVVYQQEPVNLHASSNFFLFFLQNAIVCFKELCGLSAVANLKQCILALSSRLTGPDNSPVLVFNLIDQYPHLEPQGLLPEVLKKVVTAYDLVSRSRKCCCLLRKQQQHGKDKVTQTKCNQEIQNKDTQMYFLKH